MSTTLTTHNPGELANAPTLMGPSGNVELIFVATLPYMDREADAEMVEMMEHQANGGNVYYMSLSDYPMETRKRFREALDKAVAEIEPTHVNDYEIFVGEKEAILGLLRQVAKMIDSTGLLKD